MFLLEDDIVEKLFESVVLEIKTLLAETGTRAIELILKHAEDPEQFRPLQGKRFAPVIDFNRGRPPRKNIMTLVRRTQDVCDVFNTIRRTVMFRGCVRSV